MSRRFFAAVMLLAVVLAVLWLAPGPALGQAFWPRDTPKLPMAKTWLAQKAKLLPYRPPRTSDGVPDFQGVWGGAGGAGADDIEEHEFVDVTTPPQESFISDPADGKIPYLPWALAKRNEMRAGLARGWPGETGERLHADPATYCLDAMPRIGFAGQEIIQRPGSVIMLSGSNFYRIIPIDGRPHANQDAKFWRGSSRGHWEGDTLVIEVANLNGRQWFDSAANYYSENTRVVERMKLVDANTIDYEMTFEDPTIYSRPWKINFPKRRAGTGGRGGGGNNADGGNNAEKDPYANEQWEQHCDGGNLDTQHVRELGFKWFRGVTPPK